MSGQAVKDENLSQLAIARLNRVSVFLLQLEPNDRLKLLKDAMKAGFEKNKKNEFSCFRLSTNFDFYNFRYKKTFETHTTDREDNRRVLRRKEAFYIELYEKARNDQINSPKK